MGRDGFMMSPFEAPLVKTNKGFTLREVGNDLVPQGPVTINTGTQLRTVNRL